MTLHLTVQYEPPRHTVQYSQSRPSPKPLLQLIAAPCILVCCVVALSSTCSTTRYLIALRLRLRLRLLVLYVQLQLRFARGVGGEAKWIMVANRVVLGFFLVDFNVMAWL